MPADALYWNSVDFDSDESISNTFPRNYVDPWDLENYAYIRDHLDSVEVSSEPSSFGEPAEVNSSYYAPVKSKSYSPVERKKYGSLLESDYGTAKYAEIEDVYGERPRQRPRQRVSEIKQPQVEDIYGIANFGLESDEEEEVPYKVNSRSFSTTFYESAARQPPVIGVKRRMSYSYGDYGYGNNSSQSVYSKLEENRRAESARAAPIYDDVRFNKHKPNNFGLSNYGHLKIDYSWSWNNLNKYIYN